MITIQDGAHDFRICISGKFAGDLVYGVEQDLQKALQQPNLRSVTVDISELTDYDVAGRKLLRQMHRHGVRIAASTPASLVFLGEITAPRRHGITIIPEVVPPVRPSAEPKIKPRRQTASSI